MFYLTEVEEHIRVDPKLFGLPTMESISQQLEETYLDYYDKELGRVVAIVEILNIGEGIIIPGDGAAYYKSKFKLLVWKPELQELVYGVVDEITNFGAFINLGPMKGMIHISQVMDDRSDFSESQALIGRTTRRSLKSEDVCVARIVAISHKGDEPKIGLTMRQPGLGKIDWLKEDKIKKQKETEKLAKVQEKAVKTKRGKKK